MEGKPIVVSAENVRIRRNIRIKDNEIRVRFFIEVVGPDGKTAILTLATVYEPILAAFVAAMPVFIALLGKLSESSSSANPDMLRSAFESCDPVKIQAAVGSVQGIVAIVSMLCEAYRKVDQQAKELEEGMVREVEHIQKHGPKRKIAVVRGGVMHD